MRRLPSEAGTMTAEESSGLEDEADVELFSIQAIFPELELEPGTSRKATLELEVSPVRPVQVELLPMPDLDALNIGDERLPPLQAGDVGTLHANGAKFDTVQAALTHLPPLRLHIELPEGYPEHKPPVFQLSTEPRWLPAAHVVRLEDAGKVIWEAYGRDQIVYAFIDHLQSEIERGLGFSDEPLVIDETLRQSLLAFDKQTKRNKFNQRTYDCGVCLYPKRGSICYQLQRCGHIFCIECLQDFYNDAILQGDVGIVKCMDPDCGTKVQGSKKKKRRNLHPTELLEIPIEHDTVQRYVELKLKKMLESDKCTIYCPRKWCQAPARSAKYAKFNTKDLASWPDLDDEDGVDERQNGIAEEPQQEPSSNAGTDRLAVCSKCQFAFCRKCTKGWHGDFVNCLPKRDNEGLTAEEQASYDFIRMNTSPCPSCNAACQKTMGCNHMICFACGTHYCYLCSSWLNPDNPYIHFNTRDEPCYMRLWELEEGDEGGGDGNVFAGPRAAEAQAILAAQEAAAPAAVQQVHRPPPAFDLEQQVMARLVEMAANEDVMVQHAG